MAASARVSPTNVRLAPLNGKKSHARDALAAAQYFEENDIRGLFTTLTQQLMIHQPKNAMEFMHEELGRRVEEAGRLNGVDYSGAVSEGACLMRVQAEFSGPEGKRKKTFTRLIPADEKTMRARAEEAAARTLHSVMWGAEEAPKLRASSQSPRQAHEARLAEIFQLERELAIERRLLESHSDKVALTPRRLESTPRRRVSVHSPRTHSWHSASQRSIDASGMPSAPSLSGYETGVLMCTYAAQGWQDLIAQLLDHGVDVDTGDYDKRTALHLASSEGHVGVVELLLSRNANVNTTDRMGFSPLVDACRHGHTQIQNMLRAAGGVILGMDAAVGVPDDNFLEAATKDRPALRGFVVSKKPDDKPEQTGGKRSDGAAQEAAASPETAPPGTTERQFSVARKFNSEPQFRASKGKFASSGPLFTAERQDIMGAKSSVPAELAARSSGAPLSEEARDQCALKRQFEASPLCRAGGPRFGAERPKFQSDGPRFGSCRRF